MSRIGSPGPLAGRRSMGKHDDKVAAAAVARSGDSELLGASSVVFRGISDAETVVALAIREALSLE